MPYVFNKITIIVIVGIVFITVMTFNEVAKFATKVKARNAVVYSDWIDQQVKTYATQEECQQDTLSICNFSECDFVPIGTSVEEVCGEDFSRGWRSTSVAIPVLYQDLASVELRIAVPSSTGVLTIVPPQGEITYTSESSEGSLVQERKDIAYHDSVLITNKFVLYEFTRLAERSTPQDAVIDTDTTYTLSVHPCALNNDCEFESVSVFCRAPECSREIIDIKNDILRLWGDDIVEE